MPPPLSGADTDVKIHRTQGHGQYVASESPRDKAQNPKRATKGLLKLKRGRLIFIGSVVGGIGSAGQVNYSASKSGLLGMARSFARELGSRGITANVIAPGFVETDMTAELTEARRDEIAKAVPMGRFCSAEEIAAVVSFIASDAASYISGALIPVDGGLGMGH